MSFKSANKTNIIILAPRRWHSQGIDQVGRALAPLVSQRQSNKGDRFRFRLITQLSDQKSNDRLLTVDMSFIQSANKTNIIIPGTHGPRVVIPGTTCTQLWARPILARIRKSVYSSLEVERLVAIVRCSSKVTPTTPLALPKVWERHGRGTPHTTPAQ